jgi:hypothetical protein
MRAIEQFAAHVTVPVLYDDPKAADQVGTGTLFSIDERLFLVTASHLFDDRDPGRFTIPAPPSTQLYGLGDFNLIRTADFYDIAVLELQDGQTISRLTGGWWQPLTLANVGRASESGIFALSGYPSARAVKRGDLIGASLITAYTERMSMPPAEAEHPIDPRLDLFFRYNREALDVDGKTIKTPDLHGCSGASIFEYRESDVIQFWTPEQCLKIVGVQSSFRRGDYFRGKSWDAVLELLRRTDVGLRAAVEAFELAQRRQ